MKISKIKTKKNKEKQIKKSKSPPTNTQKSLVFAQNKALTIHVNIRKTE